MVSLSVFIVSHDQAFIDSAKHKIPNLKYIFVGSGKFNLIAHREDVIIARNLPFNIEKEKYLLSFTAWYLISKNKLCSTSHALILEYDSILFSDFYTETMKILEQGYEAISYRKYEAFPLNVMFFPPSRTEYLNSEVLKFAKVEEFSAQKKWYSSTNHCMSVKILDDFVDWYFNLCPIIKKHDFLYLSWYHERFFSIFLTKNKIKHYLLEGTIFHQFVESHELSGANSLTYFKWELYLALNPDVAKTFGHNERAAKHHFIHYGQKEGRLLRIPNFNWEIYLQLNPQAKEECKTELAASLHYLKNPQNLKYPRNFDWHAYLRYNPQLAKENIITRDDVTLYFLKNGFYNKYKDQFIILLDGETSEDVIKHYIDNTSWSIITQHESKLSGRIETLAFTDMEFVFHHSTLINGATHIIKIDGDIIVKNIKEIVYVYYKDNILHGPINVVAHKNDKDRIADNRMIIFHKAFFFKIDIEEDVEHLLYDAVDSQYNMIKPVIHPL